jgi:hypothetical protein
MRYLSSLIPGATLVLFVAGCDRTTDIAGPNAANSKPVAAFVFEKTNEQDIPWDEPVQNPCNPLEVVVFTGSSHVLMHTWSDNNLGFHLSTSVTSKGTGLGVPTDDTFNASGSTQYDAMVPDPTTTSTFEHIVVAIGPRQADNFEIHYIAKITFAATGMPTATFDRSFAKCTG